MKPARNSCETQPLQNAHALRAPLIVYTGNAQLSDRFTAFNKSLSALLGSWLGWVCVWLLTLSSSVIADPAVSAPKSQVTQTKKVAELANYSDSSDAELTQLVKNWPRLSPTQRRLLLSEVRSRMKQAGSQASQNSGDKNALPQADLNRVMAQQTYGRTVQRADGSTVTETETVKITPQGRQVTRKTTITSAAKGNPNTAASGQLGADPARVQTSRRVVRAKIRFGTGFEQRHGAVNPNLDSQQASIAAQKISTDDAGTAPESDKPQR